MLNKNERKVFRSIEPLHGFPKLDLQEVWQFRELFYMLTWRDIKVRYKQTVVGIVWVLLQPFLLMLVFSFFFGKLLHVSSDNAPYPIFVYSGLLLWNYFSVALGNASNALVENENLIKKIYFPRLLLPLSATITPIIDLLVACSILGLLLVYYHFTPHLSAIIVVPFAMLICFISAAGLGLLLSAINIRFRDVRHALPFFIQVLFFVTPVLYPVSIVSAKYAWVFSINPIASAISAMRASIIGNAQVNYPSLVGALAISFALFTLGLIVFKRSEGKFSDIA